MLSQTDQDKIQAFLIDEDTTGTALLTLVVDRYMDAKKNENPLTWQADTLYQTMAEDIGAPSPSNFNKLMAARIIDESDRYFTNLRDWILLSTGLIDGDVDFHSPDLPDPDVFIPAAYEAVLLHSPGNKAPFNAEIQHYMDLSLAEHGSAGLKQVLGMTDGDDLYGRRLAFVAREHGPEVQRQYSQRSLQEAARLNQLGAAHVRRIFEQLHGLNLRYADLSKALAA